VSVALSINQVEKAFGETKVLRGIDLAVPTGSFTAVLGQSGSGKTTLLRLIAGFDRVDAGEIHVAGVRVEGDKRPVPPDKRRIGFVPQDGALFPHLTVAKNIGFGLNGPDRATRVDQLLELVGLRQMGGRYPHQLSGGQQQRVAVARALAVRPAVVLMDEPFSALDPALRASLRADVRVALASLDTTAILVTHDQDEALSMADQVAVIRDGRIAQAGSPELLYTAPVDEPLARFVGDANVIPGTKHGACAATPLGELPLRRPDLLPEDHALRVLIRPEQIELIENPDGHIRATVVASEYYGHDTVVAITADPIGGDVLRVRSSLPQRPAPGSIWGLRLRGPFTAWSDSAS
jgi:iron(III) transport system ATP-binding protein